MRPLDPFEKISNACQRIALIASEHRSFGGHKAVMEALGDIGDAAKGLEDSRTLSAARGVHPEGTPTPCADCGTPLNEGEAKTFTVCDGCWDKKYKGASSVPSDAEPLEFYARCLEGCARVMALRHAVVDHGENYCTCGYLRARAVHSEQARQELPSRVHTPAPTEPTDTERLDFIESKRADVYTAWHDGAFQGFGVAVPPGYDTIGDDMTLRGAIDSARERTTPAQQVHGDSR